MIDIEISRSGRFRGYASIFNSPDLARDVIVSGAFARSLRQRGTKRVRMLYQHEIKQPIGVWHHLEEDGLGLSVEGSLLLNVKRAYEIYMLIQAGALDGLSIGFRTVRASHNSGASHLPHASVSQHGMRFVHEIDLVEISIVTFPMHPQARIRLIESEPSSLIPEAANLAGDLRKAAHSLTL